MIEEPTQPRMDRVADLEVPLSVLLAEKPVSLAKILELRPGAVLELSRRHDSPLEVLVSGSRIGRGRAVDIGERIGIRIDEVDLRGERDAPKSREDGPSGEP